MTTISIHSLLNTAALPWTSEYRSALAAQWWYFNFKQLTDYLLGCKALIEVADLKLKFKADLLQSQLFFKSLFLTSKTETRDKRFLSEK